MLFRFCLYGFLKNQRYFEPFFMLALLAHGLNFFEIGLLYACRSLTLNVLEIPSGVIADQWGRRASMIGSFAAYIISFLMFAFVDQLAWLTLAMVLYGVGDSFRTGTHKAMIFQWLKNQGRAHERTQVYGFTRSWSQYGSAVSALIAAAFVIASGDYRSVFLAATLPYFLNIVNFLGYPADVDGAGANRQEDRQHEDSPSGFSGRLSATFGYVRHLFGSTLQTIHHAWQHRQLRGLIAQSMAWEGVFAAIKDYLQPALLAVVLLTLGTSQPLSVNSNANADVTAVAQAKLSLDAGSGASAGVVLTISLTYTALFLLSGWASRSAHKLVSRAGSHARASQRLWWASIGLYAVLGLSDLLSWTLLVVCAFVLLAILENVWRPILISRFDDHAAAHLGATILSIESQSQRLATLVVAPLVGWSIDTIARNGGPGHLWPIGVIGALAGLAAISSSK
ncbi:MAG: MFS transporter [Pirellulaceae bacterium]|jgi:MFS family permease|nr:MFS transporter [Pirellulaceae bacterium]